MEDLKAFFASKGIEPKDIPKGIVAHEMLGIGILASAWACCYIVRPTASLYRISRTSHKIKINTTGLSNSLRAAQEKANNSKIVRFVNSSKYLSSQKAQRLSVAFAESYLLRKLLMPVLVPLKFWLSFKMVLLSKKMWYDSKYEMEGSLTCSNIICINIYVKYILLQACIYNLYHVTRNRILLKKDNIAFYRGSATCM